MKSTDKVTALVALARKLAPTGSGITSTQLLCSALMRDASANLLRCDIRLREIKARPAKARRQKRGVGLVRRGSKTIDAEA